MESTRINRPPKSEPASGENDRVHQGAPTLMGGEIPGSQGVVRVWSPSVWLMRSYLVVAIGFVLYGIGSYLEGQSVISDGSSFGSPSGVAFGCELSCVLVAAALLVFGGGKLYISVKLLQRPRFVTTDDAGIAIVTQNGSQTLLWTELKECSRVGSTLTLATTAGPVTARLSGYLPCVVRELFATILQRADLYQAEKRRIGRVCPRRYVRPDRLTTALRTQPKIEPSGPRARRDGILSFVGLLVLTTIVVARPFVMSRVYRDRGRYMNAETYGPSDPHFGGISAWRDRQVEIMNSTLRGHLDFGKPYKDSSSGHLCLADIFVPQAPGEGLATVRVPGEQIGSQSSNLAAVNWRRTHASVYEYFVFFNSSAKTMPRSVIIQLDYGNHNRSIRATLSNSTYFEERDPELKHSITTYSNNWGDHRAAGIDEGPFIGELPSPRDWTYAAVGVPRPKLHPNVRGFYFDPAPAAQDLDLSTRRPTASAAWLPGVVTASGVWCTVRFTDGASERFRVDSRSAPAGVQRIWGLTAKQKAKLPAGPF